jgi:hypothetical protein
LDSRHIWSPANAKVAGVVGAGFGAQNAIAASIAASVILGKRRLVIPAQHRVTGLALIQHRLEFALIMPGHASAEQMSGALSAADQYAELAGALEQRLPWRGAFDDDVGGQFHLGHAVAVARLHCRTLDRAEDGQQRPRPVG